VRVSGTGDQVARALELSRAVDAEMDHLRRALQLFGRLAEERSAPRFLRESAGAARDHLDSVVRTFSVEEGEA
jgi:hypothetical protein